MANLWLYSDSDSNSLTELVKYALQFAKDNSDGCAFDCFTCLGTALNYSFLKDLKFNPGAEGVNYYMYNYEFTGSIILSGHMNLV